MQLHDVYHCEVQIGGSDQWGNMVQGVELIRKKNGESSYSLSYPLIINPKTGKKFGKTESGSAIWLDPEKTHPFDFYQFLVNIDDEMAPLLMKYFSFKTHDEIQELQILWDTEREKRLLQKTLAFEVTALVHGQEVAHQCRQIASILFEKGSEAITVENLEFIKKALPYATIKSGEEFIKENVILQLGLVSSKGEARRLIEQNGVKEELLFGKYYLIRKGKRDYGIIELV
jgi:tyrosyl-tRNA synthetase